MVNLRLKEIIPRR